MNKFTLLLKALGVGDMPFVALEVYEMSFDLGVLDLLVAEELFDVEDVFGAVLLYFGFPVV